MIKSRNSTNEQEYKNHEIFGKLNKMIEFYKLLSYSISGFIKNGTKTTFNIDYYILSSIQGTLESIKEITKNGRINDAYALLRKYYDMSIINIYSDICLKDYADLEKGETEKINNRINGKETLPEFKEMIKYISNSNKLSKLNKIFFKNKNYKKIRDNCNDHIHYNLYYNIVLNDNEIYLEDRIKELNNFSNTIEELFILHISYLFFTNEYYMKSSDFEDYSDLGFTPPDNCQYWIAPFIQKIFNEFIKNKKKDIANVIIENTKMQLE